MQTKNTFNTKKLGLFGLVTVATLGATALANAETYTVQKGDTLSAIAKKNGTTVDEWAILWTLPISIIIFERRLVS